MVTFSEIRARAERNAGGAEALDVRLPEPKSAAALRAVTDDRYLSLMSLRIFRAGLKHSLVDAKWPAFEEAFHGFEPRRVRAMSDEDIEKLMGDARLIRHWGKIRSVHANAAALCDLAGEAGGMGAWLADWPGARVVDLWSDLTKRFKQLGGSSGPMFLRMAGKDTFILSPDVVRGLQGFGVCDAPPKGKRAQATVQDAFNVWADESGRPLCQLSMTLAIAAG